MTIWQERRNGVRLDEGKGSDMDFKNEDIGPELRERAKARIKKNRRPSNPIARTASESPAILPHLESVPE